jgi:hypothetical protein
MKTLAVLLMLVAPAAAAELRDPGFEGGDLGAWTAEGRGWLVAADTNRSHGAYIAACEVAPGEIELYRILHQEFPVAAGSVCSGGAWIRAAGVESTESYFELQFWDAFGATVRQVQSRYASADQPYAFHGLENVPCPAGAVVVSVRLVVHMSEAPRNDVDLHLFDDVRFEMAKP